MFNKNHKMMDVKFITNSKKIGKVRRWQSKDFFKYAFTYLVVYILVLLMITTIMYLYFDLDDFSFQVDTFTIVTKVFLFILGIYNFTVTFKDYILQGISRKEFLVGTFEAIAGLCIFFTALLTGIYAVVEIVEGRTIDSDTAVLMFSSLILFYAYFIIGWFLGMCFLKYRAIGGLAAIIVAAVGIAIMEYTTSIGFMSIVGTLDMTKATSIPLMYNLLSTVIFSFLISYFVYAKTKKIYFKI